MRNHCYENDFNLHENEPACRTHFHMKGFALRLVLKQREGGREERKKEGRKERKRKCMYIILTLHGARAAQLTLRACWVREARTVASVTACSTVFEVIPRLTVIFRVIEN